MKKFIKENISLGQFFTGFFLFAAITGYCFIKSYPYIIPILFLFFSLHLFFIKKASRKLFLNFGLLAVILLSMAHAVIDLGGWSPYYTPVAVIGMLTMILFNDLELMFIMSLLSSWLATLVLGGDIGMLITFFLGRLSSAVALNLTSPIDLSPTIAATALAIFRDFGVCF